MLTRAWNISGRVVTRYLKGLGDRGERNAVNNYRWFHILILGYRHIF